MSKAASRFGHFHDENGRSTFRVFAREKHKVVVHLTDTGHALPLAADPLGYWHASCDRLAEGSRGPRRRQFIGLPQRAGARGRIQ